VAISQGSGAREKQALGFEKSAAPPAGRCRTGATRFAIALLPNSSMDTVLKGRRANHRHDVQRTNSRLAQCRFARRLRLHANVYLWSEEKGHGAKMSQACAPQPRPNFRDRQSAIE
jgi:hypothetical protein